MADPRTAAQQAAAEWRREQAAAAAAASAAAAAYQEEQEYRANLRRCSRQALSRADQILRGLEHSLADEQAGSLLTGLAIGSPSHTSPGKHVESPV